MEQLIAYYTGSVATIALLIETLKQIDDKVPQWSLKDKIKWFGYEFSYLNLFGVILSFIAAAVMTLYSSYGIVEGVAGWIAIYFTEYGAGKLGWRKVISLILKLKGFFKG